MKRSLLKRELIFAYSRGDDAALGALADVYVEEDRDDLAQEIRKGKFWTGWDVRKWPVKGIEGPKEGWWVCECSGSHNGRWQVQAITEHDCFENDEHAWGYVWHHALVRRNLTCASALALVARMNKLEKQVIDLFLETTGGYATDALARVLSPLFGTADNMTHEWIRPGSLVRVADSEKFDGDFFYVVELLRDDFTIDPRHVSCEGVGYHELEPVMRPRMTDGE